MANNRFNIWAGPSVGGTKAGVWGPWYTSAGLIVKENTSASVHLDFSTTDVVVQMPPLRGQDFSFLQRVKSLTLS